MITRELLTSHLPFLSEKIGLHNLPSNPVSQRDYFTRSISGRSFRTSVDFDMIRIDEHSRRDFHFWAWIDRLRPDTGTLSYNLFSEKPGSDTDQAVYSDLNGHGGEFYQGAHAILGYFNTINRILRIWNGGTNLEQYYAMLEAGLQPTDAALRTWSGFQAQELLYSRAEEAEDVKLRHDRAVAFYFT